MMSPTAPEQKGPIVHCMYIYPVSGIAISRAFCGRQQLHSLLMFGVHTVVVSHANSVNIGSKYSIVDRESDSFT